MLLYIFARLQENPLRKGTSMTGITINNIQRAVTPKAGNLKLWFLHYAYPHMV